MNDDLIRGLAGHYRCLTLTAENRSSLTSPAQQVTGAYLVATD